MYTNDKLFTFKIQFYKVMQLQTWGEVVEFIQATSAVYRSMQ